MLCDFPFYAPLYAPFFYAPPCSPFPSLRLTPVTYNSSCDWFILNVLVSFKVTVSLVFVLKRTVPKTAVFIIMNTIRDSSKQKFKLKNLTHELV